MFNVFVKTLGSIDIRKVPLEEAAKHIYKKVVFCIDHMFISCFGATCLKDTNRGLLIIEALHAFFVSVKSGLHKSIVTFCIIPVTNVVYTGAISCTSSFCQGL